MHLDFSLASLLDIYNEKFNIDGLGTTGAKCNLMGYWHTKNNGIYAPSSKVKSLDTLNCLLQCTNKTCGFDSSVTPYPDSNSRLPLVDFVGVESDFTPVQYKSFPDLQLLPTVGVAVVPIYNLPFLNGSHNLVLSRATLSNIYLGK